jgi:hypothetical protein
MADAKMNVLLAIGNNTNHIFPGWIFWLILAIPVAAVIAGVVLVITLVSKHKK